MDPCEDLPMPRGTVGAAMDEVTSRSTEHKGKRSAGHSVSRSGVLEEECRFQERGRALNIFRCDCCRFPGTSP